MMPITWLPLAGRFLVVWALVAVFFYYSGEFIVRVFLPWLATVTNMLAEYFHADLSIVPDKQGVVIKILARVTQDIYQYNFPIAPKGAELTAVGTLAHALTPLVIFFALVLSWPGSFKALVLRVVMGVPVGIVLLSAILPCLLVSHIEGVFHSALQTVAKKEMPMPFIMTWVIFMEMGGVWLLPIMGALGCVAVTHPVNYKKPENID
jgi:hypothetical protein